MAGKYEAPRQKRNPLVFLIPLILTIAIAAAFLLWPEPEEPAPKPVVTVPTQTTTPPTTLPPETTQAPTEPDHIVATATISSQGDLLMHKPIFNDSSACKNSDGSYDFSSVFRYLTDYTQSYDYAVANLETTFGGDAHPYQGWPLFNCPDPFKEAITAAGFDMLLTSNNHCYDTLMAGLKRTLEQSREAGLATLGTRLTEEELPYAVVDINGIQVGMVSYTYTTSVASSGKPQLNGNAPVENPKLVNYFSYSNLPKFYTELEDILSDMEAAGAEATILYIHWGTEYEIKENGTQNTMAQKLCDLGIDVIVGGHPHVVQPMELLTSTVDPDHKSVCVYSLGNAVSNQRRYEMRLNTGHTEDGLLFTATFGKQADGLVKLLSVDAIPTWVNMHTGDNGREYNILPLETGREDAWQEAFDLTDEQMAECRNSYKRTMDIIGEGLKACQDYLAETAE